MVFLKGLFVRFAMLRKLMGGSQSRRLIAFDIFSDKYPNTKFKEDQTQRKHWIKTAGSSSISTNQLKYLKKSN